MPTPTYKEHVSAIQTLIAEQDKSHGDLLRNANEIGVHLEQIEIVCKAIKGVKYSDVCKIFTHWDHKKQDQVPYGANWTTNHRAIAAGWRHILAAQQDGTFPYAASVNVAKAASWVRDNHLAPERKAERDRKAQERKDEKAKAEAAVAEIFDTKYEDFENEVGVLKNEVFNLKGALEIAKQEVRNERMAKEALQEELAKYTGKMTDTEFTTTLNQADADLEASNLAYFKAAAAKKEAEAKAKTQKPTGEELLAKVRAKAAVQKLREALIDKDVAEKIDGILDKVEEDMGAHISDAIEKPNQRPVTKKMQWVLDAMTPMKPVQQGDLYEILGTAAGVGGLLHKLQERGLVICSPDRQWTKL